MGILCNPADLHHTFVKLVAKECPNYTLKQQSLFPEWFLSWWIAIGESVFSGWFGLSIIVL